LKKFFNHRIFKYLLSALIFGFIYSLLSLADKGSVDFAVVLRSSALYFVLMCLLYFIAPKLRKLTGHSKEE